MQKRCLQPYASLLFPAGFRPSFCSLLNPGLIEKDPPRATPTAFFGALIPLSIPQLKPTDKPRERGAAGACLAGGGVSEPTHSIALWEKQQRRAEMERAGGGKKAKTETELRGREGILAFHPQVRQGEQEECLPLKPPAPKPRMHPQPEPPGGCLQPREHRLTGSHCPGQLSGCGTSHRHLLSLKCSSFGGSQQGGGSGGSPLCSLRHSQELCKPACPAPQRQPKRATAYHETWQQHTRCFPPTPDKSAFISQLSGQAVPLPRMTVLAAGSRQCQPCHGQDVQWLFVMGFEEAASLGKQNRFGLQAEQRPKSSQEQLSGDLSVRKSSAPSGPCNLDARTASPARTQVKE